MAHLLQVVPKVVSRLRNQFQTSGTVTRKVSQNPNRATTCLLLGIVHNDIRGQQLLSLFLCQEEEFSVYTHLAETDLYFRTQSCVSV
ncbi:hypothetical protein TNCV_4043381 [Trichonephila clavipes]|nr:hypothetical protein TNCV_4043381 [Trichonephila clavipes]